MDGNKGSGQTQRVEKHVIKKNSPHFRLLFSFCHLSKNLYNHANYEIRQAFLGTGEWLRYGEVDKRLREDREFPDYASMPTAQSAQQTLRILDRNWQSFFAGIRDWARHPEKYRGRPRMPGYLKKDGCFQLVLTNQNCRLKEGVLCFPKVFEGFTVRPVFTRRADFQSFRQARLIPHRDRIVLELVYSIKLPCPDGGMGRAQAPAAGPAGALKCAGIDIGVNNLAAVCNNAHLAAFAINGRPLKSINQYYNKQAAHYREVCKRMNGRDCSRRLEALAGKRARKIDDYLHKASRKVVDFCDGHGIRTIVIGKNDGWKQNAAMSKKENQNFVQIPFARFIQMIQYKAQEKGIAVIQTEESYTSGTSFIDHEMPVKQDYDRTRRVCRGMFVSRDGTKINADLNAAYQIMKKAVPIKWDRGCGLHPVVVNM